MARQSKNTSLRRRLVQHITPNRVWALARKVGFVRRKGGKINPFQLVWTLVLGFACGKERTISGLRRAYERNAGVTLVPSSFYERFTGRLVKLLRQIAEQLLEGAIGSMAQLTGTFSGFRDVMITDATVIRLRQLLEKEFPACRTNHTKAAAKLHAVMSVTGLSKQAVRITSERFNDGRAMRIGPWVKERLLLLDLGYLGYRLFDRIRRNEGFFISRMKTNANPLIVSVNRRWRGRSVPVVGMHLQDVLSRLRRDVLDVNIQVRFYRRSYGGRRSRVATTFRLVAVRDPETKDYHVFVTNVTPEKLSAEDVALAYRARWQIELLFKSWKGELRLDELPSRKKEVVEALIYASIITMIVTQRLFAFLRAKAREQARRVTFGRVAAAVRHFASDLHSLITGAAAALSPSLLLRLLEHDVLDPHLRQLSVLERASGITPEAL